LVVCFVDSTQDTLYDESFGTTGNTIAVHSLKLSKSRRGFRFKVRVLD